MLDAGSGTGGGGELLFQRGYLNLTGMDISSGMLTEAKEKNIYKEAEVIVIEEAQFFPDLYVLSMFQNLFR